MIVQDRVVPSCPFRELKISFEITCVSPLVDPHVPGAFSFVVAAFVIAVQLRIGLDGRGNPVAAAQVMFDASQGREDFVAVVAIETI